MQTQGQWKVVGANNFFARYLPSFNLEILGVTWHAIAPQQSQSNPKSDLLQSFIIMFSFIHLSNFSNMHFHLQGQNNLFRGQISFTLQILSSYLEL